MLSMVLLDFTFRLSAFVGVHSVLCVSVGAETSVDDGVVVCVSVHLSESSR